MAYTTADLERIDRAIASGASKVQLDGRLVETRSLTDLLKIKAIIEADLNATVGGEAFRVQYVSSDKGLL